METRQMIIKLNEIKKSIGNNSFTTEELRSILKNNGFRGISALIHGMRHTKIIQKISTSKKDGSQFSEIGTPIYIGTLERAISYGKNCDKQYKINSSQKKSKDLSNPIEEAIKLLKNNGYKVLKPTYSFEEV